MTSLATHYSWAWPIPSLHIATFSVEYANPHVHALNMWSVSFLHQVKPQPHSQSSLLVVPISASHHSSARANNPGIILASSFSLLSTPSVNPHHSTLKTHAVYARLHCYYPLGSLFPSLATLPSPPSLFLPEILLVRALILPADLFTPRVEVYTWSPLLLKRHFS